MTEGPYKLPEGWRWVRLGEHAKSILDGHGFMLIQMNQLRLCQ